MSIPTVPGFYWAKWKIADEGTPEGDEQTPSNTWEVVDVYENAIDPEDDDHLRVHVPGQAMSQSLENFFWGIGPLPTPPSKSQLETACHGCARPYGEEHGFPDLVIPDRVWRLISPTGDSGGLLCPSCICKRLHAAGLQSVAAFTSGPVMSISINALAQLRKDR